MSVVYVSMYGCHFEHKKSVIFELLIMELADGLKIHYLLNWGIPLPIQVTFFWEKLVTRF